MRRLSLSGLLLLLGALVVLIGAAAIWGIGWSESGYTDHQKSIRASRVGLSPDCYTEVYEYLKSKGLIFEHYSDFAKDSVISSNRPYSFCEEESGLEGPPPTPHASEP